MSHSLAVVGAGTVFSGDHENPTLDGVDTLIATDGVISAIGRRADLETEVAAAAQVIDANGATVAPGLIDSHCHVVLGDYTPRQKTVDFLASYVHGGITSVVSPGEIHAQGRPHSAVGVKALAIAAKTCFENFHPGGMTVHAGSVVLEPTLTDEDFADLQAAGVRLAKFGFGLYDDPADGFEQVRSAQAHGITVMCHSGGASIPGSKPITPDHLGWAPNVVTENNGEVSAGDVVDTSIDGGANGVGLVGQELLALALDSSEAHAASGQWTANANLVLKTPVNVAPGSYTSTLTLSLFEDAIAE